MPIKYCWWCQGQIIGNNEVIAKVEDYPRLLHRTCFSDIAQQGKIQEIIKFEESPSQKNFLRDRSKHK
jgi:hypothetical protein